MSAENLLAANAYARSQNIGQGMGRAKIPGMADKGAKFSDILEDTVQGAINTVRHSEQMSAKAITGEASITDVVQAITEADVTITTAKALIDRMLSAYQEIMRLPI
jgi:flagellar hook-basal body complex protein FliE